jgi:hypothetical protein
VNFIIRALIKFGVLKDDLDYHFIRASMVIIFLFLGYQKWFNYEAQALIPRALDILDVSGLRVFGVRHGSWVLLSGPSGCCCYWDSGINSLGV